MSSAWLGNDARYVHREARFKRHDCFGKRPSGRLFPVSLFWWVSNRPYYGSVEPAEFSEPLRVVVAGSEGGGDAVQFAKGLGQCFLPGGAADLDEQHRVVPFQVLVASGEPTMAMEDELAPAAGMLARAELHLRHRPAPARQFWRKFEVICHGHSALPLAVSRTQRPADRRCGHTSII